MAAGHKCNVTLQDDDNDDDGNNDSKAAVSPTIESLTPGLVALPNTTTVISTTKSHTTGHARVEGQEQEWPNWERRRGRSQSIATEWVPMTRPGGSISSRSNRYSFRRGCSSFSRASSAVALATYYEGFPADK